MTDGNPAPGSTTDAPRKFGVGVIGLGRPWEVRHAPALRKLSDLFEVRAVYDQVPARAKREADRLRVDRHESFTSLIERPDIDVAMLVAPQWLGLEPVFVACSHRKAVYCSVPVASETPEQLAALDRAVTESGITFVPEFARRCYPAATRLKQLIETTLGRPRLIRCDARIFGFDRNALPGPSSQLSPFPILVDPGSYLIDWCRFLLDDEPTAIHGGGNVIVSAERDFEGLTVSFAGGAVARIDIGRYHKGNWGEAWKFLPPAGLQVFAEHGAAWLEPPDRICWSDPEGNHEERFTVEPSIGELLCANLHRTLSGEPNASPGWADARIAASLIHEVI